MLERIRSGIRLREAGKVAEARELLSGLWPDVEHGDAFERCFLAHSLADVQEDPDDELHWDLVALDAASDVTEERAAEREIPGGRLGLYPSLHLNLAEDYLRLGDDAEARRQYLAGREHLHLLADDSYGRGIRDAFSEYEAQHPDHLAKRLF